MSIMGGPIPNALGAGAQNGVDFFPHGMVAFKLGGSFQFEACVALVGEIRTTVTLVGEIQDTVQLAGEIQGFVALTGEIRDAVQLTGEITTIVTLLGEIGDCD